VLTISNSGSDHGDQQEKAIVDILEADHGFIKLEVSGLLTLEAQRRT
jgi:hypothetical protein